MSKRTGSSSHHVCPRTGLNFTVTDDYRTQGIYSTVHPLAQGTGTRLLAVIAKERWNAPKSYLIGGCFLELETKGLLAPTCQEPPLWRGQISLHLQEHYPASKLYALYCALRDTTAGMKVNPAKICLLSLTPHDPKSIYVKLLFAAKQRVTSEDLYFTSERTVTRKAQNPKAALNRVTIELKPLRRLIASQESHLIPEYYSDKVAAKLSNALPEYFDLNTKLRAQLYKLVCELFDIAIKAGYVKVDTPLYTSYFIVKDMIDPANTIIPLELDNLAGSL